jgi:hypothetical protein
MTAEALDILRSFLRQRNRLAPNVSLTPFDPALDHALALSCQWHAKPAILHVLEAQETDDSPLRP